MRKTKVNLLGLCLFCSAFFLCTTPCSSFDIDIRTQQEFDHMTEDVWNALSAGETAISVNIAPGTYYYYQYHFNFYNRKYPQARVSLKGSDCVLIAASSEGAEREPDNAVVISGKERYCWSDAFFLDRNVEILELPSKKCRIKIPKGVDVPRGTTHILITQTYRSSVYSVGEITKDHIYFTAGDLSLDSSKKDYNVNADNIFCPEVFPRVKFYVPENAPGSHICTNTVFLNLGGCSLKSFRMSGVTFVGNRNDNGLKELLQLSDCDAGCVRVENCRFEGIHSTILGIYGSSNVIFRNNTVSDCYGHGIYMTNNSSDVVIENNTFVNTGLSFTNTFCVRCEGADFIIRKNVFRDFGAYAVAAGVHYQARKEHRCNGRIVNNEMYFSEQYFDNIANFGLMDAGAIYLTTQTDGVLIARNNIHDYTGLKSNHGVFCDDGASNFTIRNNRITNTPRGRSIDARQCPEILSYPGNCANQVNAGNSVMRNRVDGQIRFNN